MTDPDSNVTTYLIGGLVALSSLAVGFGLTIGWGDGKQTTLPTDVQPPLLEHLEVWERAPERTIDIRFRPDTGPVWKVDDTEIPLNPFSSSRDPLEWTHHASDTRDLFVGRGELDGRPLVVRWAFARGNPQARMSVELRGEGDAELSKPVSGTLSLPEGTVHSTDRRLRVRELSSDDPPRTLSAWTPPWVQWRHEAHALTLTRWTGDGLSLSHPGEGGPRWTFHLWRPDQHPIAARCNGAWPGDPTVEGSSRDAGQGSERNDASGSPPADTRVIRAEATFIFGEAPPIVPWRYPEGRLAALAPIFDRATAHPDETLHAGAATDAGEWLRRARTLLYGHSDSEDPRFGNGGLLGHGLGGTVVAPSAFVGSKDVRAFRDGLSGAPAEVGVRDRLPSDAGALRTLLLDERTCDVTSSSAAEHLEVVIDQYTDAEGRVFDLLAPRLDTDRPLWSAPVGNVPTSMVLPRLGGSRRVLVEEVLTGSKLRRLVEARGAFSFATPLTGSRNPLVPSAREALLSPERYGHWTLAGPFVTALANLGVMREAIPFVALGPADLTAYWRHARRVDATWRADGTLSLRNPSTDPISDFTLALAAPPESDDDPTWRDGTLELADASLRGQRRTSTYGPHRWLWWSLKGGGTYRLRVKGEEAPNMGAPTPVEWDVQQKR